MQVLNRPDVSGVRAHLGDDASDDLPVEQTVGVGSERVYVYFSHAERTLAELHGRDRWPCKVGFTARGLRARIIVQGAGTSIYEFPCVGWGIRTDDACLLEKPFHHALVAANCRIESTLGSEWFFTSPGHIVEFYGAYPPAVSQCGRHIDGPGRRRKRSCYGTVRSMKGAEPIVRKPRQLKDFINHPWLPGQDACNGSAIIHASAT